MFWNYLKIMKISVTYFGEVSDFFQIFRDFLNNYFGNLHKICMKFA